MSEQDIDETRDILFMIISELWYKNIISEELHEEIIDLINCIS
jgi:hypothetical protein